MKRIAYIFGGIPSGTDLTKLDELVWGSVSPTSSTNMTLAYNFSESTLDGVIAAAHAAGIKCTLQIYAPYGSEYLNYNKIYSDSTVKASMIAAIGVVLAAHPTLDGVSFDWECDNQGIGASHTLAQVTAFFAALKSAIGSKLISAVENFGGVTMTSGAQAYLDWIGLMTYDAGTLPASYCTLADVIADLARWRAAGFSDFMLVPGISLYWLIDGSWNSGSVEYRWIVDNYDPSPGANSVVTPSGTRYGNGLTLAQTKAQYVKDNNYGGLFVFHLSMDKLGDPRSIVGAISTILATEPPPAPPGTSIDVGAAATVRTDGLTGTSYTIVPKDNPVNAAGTITSVDIYVDAGGVDIADLTVAAFYLVSGTTLKVRSSTYVGAVTKGSTQTKPVSLAVQAGDLIGSYYTTAGAWIRYDPTGGAGVYYFDGECKDVGDEAVFFSQPDWTMSLYGSGGGNAAPAGARAWGVIIG